MKCIYFVKCEHACQLIQQKFVLVYTASGDGVARMYDAKSGALKRSFKTTESEMLAMNALQVTGTFIEFQPCFILHFLILRICLIYPMSYDFPFNQGEF